MTVSAAYELRSFAAAVIMGLFIGAAYDIARSFRYALKRNMSADILMWIFIGWISARIWYVFLNGEIRWYMFLGAFSALVLYFSLISASVFCAFSFAAEKICYFLNLILKILLTPIKFLCKIVSIFKEKAKQKSLREVEDKNDEEKAGF